MPISDQDLRDLAAHCRNVGRLVAIRDGKGMTLNGEELAEIASECMAHRNLVDAARCRITALEEAGFHEIAHLVRESTKKVPL